MTNAKLKCPYAIGESVMYAPSAKGLGYALPDENLIAGKKYIIESIVKDAYIIVVGYNSVGGGLHWTEFKSVQVAPTTEDL